MSSVRTGRFTGDLWLTAHDSPSFKAQLPSRTLGIALATGLVTELLLAERVFLDAGGRLRLHRPERLDDPALDPIVRELDAEQHRRGRRPLQEQGLPGHDLRVWLMFLAVEDYAFRLVAERLAESGALVREQRPALLRRRTQRWVPADSTVSGRPANRIAGGLERGSELHLTDLITAALYLATGLDAHALAIVDQKGRAGLARQIGAVLPPVVRELLRTADALIGESAMTSRR